MGLFGRGLSGSRDLPLLPALRRGTDERLWHDRGHRRHHDDAPRPLQGRLAGARPAGHRGWLWPTTGELVVRGPYVTMGYMGAGGARSPRSAKTAGFTPATSSTWTRTVTSASSTARRRSTRTSKARRSRRRRSRISSATSNRSDASLSSATTALTTLRSSIRIPSFKEIHLRSLPPSEFKEHFRSLVVTANSFLAPYERIVAFAIIDRDFEAERDELTAKNTFRRKVIERNFGECDPAAVSADDVGRRRHAGRGPELACFKSWESRRRTCTSKDRS